MSMIDPCVQLHLVGPDRAGPLREGSGPYFKLFRTYTEVTLTAICSKRTFSILFLASLLARAFASKRGLHAFLLSGLQIKGVSFDLLDNVFLLHLALETAQRIFEGFSLLQANFSQINTPPDSSG